MSVHTASPTRDALRVPPLLRTTVATGLLVAATVSLVRAVEDPSPTAAASRVPIADRAAAFAISPVQSCLVRHRITSDAGSRFDAAVTITNSGRTRVDGWNLRWTYPESADRPVPWLGDGRNAVVLADTIGGLATDVGSSRVIAPGAAVTFGYRGTTAGPAPVPTRFTLNGMTCR